MEQDVTKSSPNPKGELGYQNDELYRSRVKDAIGRRLKNALENKMQHIFTHNTIYHTKILHFQY